MTMKSVEIHQEHKCNYRDHRQNNKQNGKKPNLLLVGGGFSLEFFHVGHTMKIANRSLRGK
jgi:hypothetical protein